MLQAVALSTLSHLSDLEQSLQGLALRSAQISTNLQQVGGRSDVSHWVLLALTWVFSCGEHPALSQPVISVSRPWPFIRQIYLLRQVGTLSQPSCPLRPTSTPSSSPSHSPPSCFPSSAQSFRAHSPSSSYVASGTPLFSSSATTHPLSFRAARRPSASARS